MRFLLAPSRHSHASLVSFRGLCQLSHSVARCIRARVLSAAGWTPAPGCPQRAGASTPARPKPSVRADAILTQAMVFARPAGRLRPVRPWRQSAPARGPLNQNKFRCRTSPPPGTPQHPLMGHTSGPMPPPTHKRADMHAPGQHMPAHVPTPLPASHNHAPHMCTAHTLRHPSPFKHAPPTHTNTSPASALARSRASYVRTHRL